MADRRCRTCDHFVRIAYHGNSQSGRCMYKAPPAIQSIVKALTADISTTINYEKLLDGNHPTSADDVCSEWIKNIIDNGHFYATGQPA